MEEEKTYFELLNEGAGIAIDVEWTFLEPPDGWRPVELGSCAPAMRKLLYYDQDFVGAAELKNFGGVRVTYKDTAGIAYWSEIRTEYINRAVFYTTYTGRVGSSHLWSH